MFTVEIRINGHLMTNIYGYNVGTQSDIGLYDVDTYRPEKHEFRRITLKHKRSEGIDALILKIMKEIVKGKPDDQRGS